jgi:hypothetical protein
MLTYIYNTSNKHYKHIIFLIEMFGMYTFVQNRQKSDLPHVRYVSFCNESINNVFIFTAETVLPKQS